MERSPDPREQRLKEVVELFTPPAGVSHKEFSARLADDKQIRDELRDRFEQGRLAGRFPALSEFWAYLSPREREAFFETGGIQAISSLKVPKDSQLRIRQLRRLLKNEPEFRTRYPQAYDIFSPNRAQSTEQTGLPLPSFGIRIPRHLPLPHIQTPNAGAEGDAYSVTYLHQMELGHPPVDQSFHPLDRDFLRSLLLNILIREEFSERIAPIDLDSDVLAGLDVPRQSAVRLTDLRLGIVLDPEALERELVPALKLLNRPITARHVVEWKHQCIGNRSEDAPDTFLEEFGERTNNSNRSVDQEAWAGLREQMLEHTPTRKPKPPTEGLSERELEALKVRIAVASFAAAALFLFIDMDTPDLDRNFPYRLARQITELAALIRKLAIDLSDRTSELEKLLANRTASGEKRSDGDCYQALVSWRLGRSLQDIAREMKPKRITPYSSKTGKGTRGWRKVVTGIIDRGKEIENKRYPRAADIFANYKDSAHIRRKAHRAYRTYLLQTTRMPGYYPFWEVGRKIRVNHQKRRGLEIIHAYVQLGYCLVRNRSILP
jgi:hypothetical protein